jgi:hypothetical protein
VELLIASGSLFCLGQLFCLAWFVPERTSGPKPPSRLARMWALGLYRLAYVLSVLRLPFAVPPYAIKLLSVFLFRRHYTVSQYNVVVEAIRILGDVTNWGFGLVLIRHISMSFPDIAYILCLCALAEMLRLFAEKGQMILSAIWQLLPHHRLARYIEIRLTQTKLDSILMRHLVRYCDYYALDDAARIQYVLDTLRCYASADPEASAKLAYLGGLRIVSSFCGLRGGNVRDVARGEVFIHRSWTADPWLLIGQALRRTPWMFDPRYLRRPFYYRSESNRLATLFVLAHARYCPTYALYQFGHEIKAARYDLFYRLMRYLNCDIEPTVLADGTFAFDPGISWLHEKLQGTPFPSCRALWSDEEAIADVRYRLNQGEYLSALDIALQYIYPLKYIEEVFINKL